jgi:hypothetical protein
VRTENRISLLVSNTLDIVSLIVCLAEKGESNRILIHPVVCALKSLRHSKDRNSLQRIT